MMGKLPDPDTEGAMEKTESQSSDALVLVTGATGYIGGRIVPRLLEMGVNVRCMVRDAARVQGRTWVNEVELVEGDVLKPETLVGVMKGVSVAYYLIHSLVAGADFPERDVRAARNFGDAARAAGVKRIIYLGGLGDPNTGLSKHLRSRQDTGNMLRESGVPVTEFRAGVIVGSGSLSFEMIRYLTERVPIMICPRWVYTRIQPIAVRNVVDYLVDALKVSDSAGRIIEIGGTDVVTYGDLLMFYAQVRGLRRRLIPVPLLTPKLSSYWVHFVTPIPSVIAQPLIEGLRNEVIVRDNLARRLFPSIELLDYKSAVRLALEKLRAHEVETAWSDSLATSQGDVAPVKLKVHEGMIMERRTLDIDAPAEAIYRTFTGIGGRRGWFYMNWAWSIRGLIDRVFGGVGLRRGRRDADLVRVGEALDFWRVEAVDPNHLLRLRAEMKLPGKAWLQFEVKPEGRDHQRSRLIQTAYFAPKGLFGLAYWYLLYPIHKLIFKGLICRIAEISQRALELDHRKA